MQTQNNKKYYVTRENQFPFIQVPRNISQTSSYVTDADTEQTYYYVTHEISFLSFKYQQT